MSTAGGDPPSIARVGAAVAGRADRVALADVHAWTRATALFGSARRLALPIAITLVVAVAAAFAAAPIRDAATLGEASDVYLVRPTAYLLFAPVSDVLDALTLASERQNVALVIGVVAIWAAIRCVRSDGARRDVRGHAASFAALLAGLVAAYAAAVLVPRPMVQLASPDPDVLRVDFHSHTQSSVDARRSYAVEDSRAWHRAGGYDVAYVTDHRTFVGAERALSADPIAGREGVMLLPGIEVNWRGEHVGVLGSERACRRVLSADLRELDPGAFAAAVRRGARLPLMIWNHPRDPGLEALPFADPQSRAGVSAMEASNGAPHALDLVRAKRGRIVARAREHGLALTAGTDSHGWGYAAPNWTLLRIEHWRELNRDDLAEAIERRIREGGVGATRVVERANADPGASTAALAFSAVLVPWQMLRTLSPAERRMWLVWTWVLGAARAQWSRRPATRLASPGAGASRAGEMRTP